MATLAPSDRKTASDDRRGERYRRRSIIQHLGQRIARTGNGWANHPFRRCASCGIVNVDDTISIKVRQGDDGPTAYTVGLSTCASVWSCAVCSAKIRSRRSMEVQALAMAHTAAGGHTGMMTLTVRHTKDHTLAELMRAQAGAWRALQQSQDWRDLRETDGLIGQVRSWEITHGFFKGEANNGWHPHFHVLMLWEGDDDRSDAVAWIQRLWSDLIEQRLGCAPDDHGFRYQRLDAHASKYVAKIANEMTRADLKGSASIWQLIDALEDGETWVYHRVLEYFKATKGKRAIQWSRGLRARYGLGVEKTDEELVAEIVAGQTVDEMNPQTWRRMCKYERGKAPACVAYLQRIEARHNRPGPVPQTTSATSTALVDAGST